MRGVALTKISKKSALGESGDLAISLGRLSALPSFFKSSDFWLGALDPRLSIQNQARFRHLREFSSSHAWGIEEAPGASRLLPTGTELTTIEIALGILQRGAWTPCTWLVEQAIAQRMSQAKLCEFTPYPVAAGILGFDAQQSNPTAFKNVLISGRLANEVAPDAAERMWTMAAEIAGAAGSSAEKQFFDEVLVPTLGFPLLDYLRFQAELKDLGVDSSTFARQRTDFSIDTGRGLRLVIEVDGSQHQTPAQQSLDRRRDAALRQAGWTAWRVPVSELHDSQRLREQLTTRMRNIRGGSWGLDLPESSTRTFEVMNTVWGATIVARIQFLLLEAMKQGLLSTEDDWHIFVHESETDMAALAIQDFTNWFGRLRGLWGLPDLPKIELMKSANDAADFSIFISCTNPCLEPTAGGGGSVAFSRPANHMVNEPSLRFTRCEYLHAPPAKDLLAGFVQDFFRKTELREGQLEILSRILMNQDVVGLLPTGGGKSLTYQLASLLLPGATLYVAPLKSLLQDQYERLKADGIDGCGFISSALNTQERTQQEARFNAGKMRLLLVAPERFLMAGFRALLQSYQSHFGAITQVVVDECHCVSEWGHDFRPAYLSLSRIVRDRTARLGSSAPVVALTGTASSIVLDDVRRELGIADAAAIVRAKRLDRPELELRFRKVALSKKPMVITEEVGEFLHSHRGTHGGLLVFTPHVNGPFGVLDVANNLTKPLYLEFKHDIRIYSGEAPKKFKQTVTPLEWDKQKAQTQRDFINPRSAASFQILVATSAFGMGIDKPSIRKVIHYLSPQSPEAYYQEIGRAARDRQPAMAVMLFSDEAAETTDKVLSPETEIDEAREIYNSLKPWMPVGDFLTTFFFHANRFTGVDKEAEQVVECLRAIKSLVDKNYSVVLKYNFDNDSSSWNSQGPLEYSLVRLIHLGVVLDYTKNFNAKTFEVIVSQDWAQARHNDDSYRDLFLEKFEAYVKRYETKRVTPLVKELNEATTFAEIETAAITAIIQYLYFQIERRRRTSTRTMLELAREGVTNIKEARKRLLFYLQASEKFTHELELLAKAENSTTTWTTIARSVESPAEVDELRGAAARVLESYPTHPGFLFLSAITRRNPSAGEKERAKEEFQAALKIVTEQESSDAAADAAEEALRCCDDFDIFLAAHLKAVYGAWSYAQYGARFALLYASKDSICRMSIINEMLAVAQQGLPEF